MKCIVDIEILEISDKPWVVISKSQVLFPYDANNFVNVKSRSIFYFAVVVIVVVNRLL